MPRYVLKKSRSHVFRKAALTLAEGVFAHTVDFGLWVTIYIAHLSIPQSVSGQNWRAVIAADEFLRDVNYTVIKTAIQDARRRGWVKTVHRGARPEITTAGKKRLAAIIPFYDGKRTWDGRMHLVTYDIVEERKHERELLREYLKKIGCGLLQDSVWVTPYDPIDTLRSFIEDRHLRGSVIVSSLGKDGSIGEEDVRAMVIRVYKLEDLNIRYKIWIEEVKARGVVEHGLLLKYFSILKHDPQLPFALLPPWWLGDRAFEKVKTLLEKVVIS